MMLKTCDYSVSAVRTVSRRKELSPPESLLDDHCLFGTLSKEKCHQITASREPNRCNGTRVNGGDPAFRIANTPFCSLLWGTDDSVDQSTPCDGMITPVGSPSKRWRKWAVRLVIQGKHPRLWRWKSKKKKRTFLYPTERNHTAHWKRALWVQIWELAARYCSFHTSDEEVSTCLLAGLLKGNEEGGRVYLIWVWIQKSK